MSLQVEKKAFTLESSFTKLSPTIYLRDFPNKPSNDSQDAKDGENPGYPQQPPPPPGPTLVLFFWMDASLRNASKYLHEYNRLAPNSRIIFILTSAADFFFRPSRSAQLRRVKPIVDTLLSSPSSSSSSPSSAPSQSQSPLYFHVFSNGGSVTLQHVALSYRAATNSPLPAKVLMIDSAPGRSSVLRAYRAISYGLPKSMVLRFVCKVIVIFCLLGGMCLSCITRTKHPSEMARAALNDSSLISKECRRCYVYSKTDDLIPWKDVEGHADDAEERGWIVEKERFEGSEHVAHMRLDPQRYWKIVARYLDLALG